MEIITDLRQRHLAAWSRSIRELKPDGFDKIKDVLDDEFYLMTTTAAIRAGLVLDVDDESLAGELTRAESIKLTEAAWKAVSDARSIDPN